jgi:hypothetical protein
LNAFDFELSLNSLNRIIDLFSLILWFLFAKYLTILAHLYIYFSVARLSPLSLLCCLILNLFHANLSICSQIAFCKQLQTKKKCKICIFFFKMYLCEIYNHACYFHGFTVAGGLYIFPRSCLTSKHFKSLHKLSAEDTCDTILISEKIVLYYT